MQQPTAASDARSQAIMGTGPTQFNLAAVRSRATELRGSLEEVVRALTSNAHALNWEAILKKFTTINIQIMALKEQLRGVLRTVVVHPRMVDDPQFAQALPIQLASAVLPEMEAEERGVVAQETAFLDEKGVAPAPSSRYEAADSTIEDFNRLISDLAGPGGMLWGEAGHKGHGGQQGARTEMAARSRAIAKSIAAARQAQAAAAALRATNQAVGGVQPAAKRARPNDQSQPMDTALVMLLVGPQHKP